MANQQQHAENLRQSFQEHFGGRHQQPSIKSIKEKDLKEFLEDCGFKLLKKSGTKELYAEHNDGTRLNLANVSCHFKLYME